MRAAAAARATRGARRAVGTATAALAAPSCTFVAAVWDGRQVTVGSLGDSRAYWIDDEAARQLTDRRLLGPGAGRRRAHDRAAAQTRSHARHQITRWLGRGRARRPSGDRRRSCRSGPAASSVCSDGLWNYASDRQRRSPRWCARPEPRGCAAHDRAFARRPRARCRRARQHHRRRHRRHTNCGGNRAVTTSTPRRTRTSTCRSAEPR